MIKKQTNKTVIKGKIYITSTFNNTLVTITDEIGNPLVVGSTGMHGFSGTRKSTPYAATVTTESAIKKAEEKYQFQVADVLVKGIGPGREASLRAVKAYLKLIFLFCFFYGTFSCYGSCIRS